MHFRQLNAKREKAKFRKNILENWKSKILDALEKHPYYNDCLSFTDRLLVFFYNQSNSKSCSIEFNLTDPSHTIRCKLKELEKIK